jgi:hypothetical protein
MDFLPVRVSGVAGATVRTTSPGSNWISERILVLEGSRIWSVYPRMLALMIVSVIRLCSRQRAGHLWRWRILEIRLRFCHGASGVVVGVVFVVGAEFGDVADNVFGGFATRKGTLGVGPIALGLA